MSSYDHAQTIVARLVNAGISATADPRSAVPPCVLLAPPSAAFDHNCADSATGTWNAYALSPTTANADAWKALDALLAATAEVLPIEHSDFVAYPLSNDSPPVPAYRIQFTESFDL
jgi:hypothetical protein